MWSQFVGIYYSGDLNNKQLNSRANFKKSGIKIIWDSNAQFIYLTGQENSGQFVHYSDHHSKVTQKVAKQKIPKWFNKLPPIAKSDSTDLPFMELSADVELPLSRRLLQLQHDVNVGNRFVRIRPVIFL